METFKRTRKDGPGLNKEGWMTTFMDLLTILLTFFVLVFSMCSLEAGKIEELQDSLKAVMGVLELGERSDYNIGFPIISSDMKNMESIHGSGLAELEDELDSLRDEKDVKVKVTKRGVVITMADKVLFDLGVSEINPEAFPLMNKIITVLKANSSFPVRVEGHTDNLPIKTERFPSNWELSIARAVNVVKFFIKDGEILPERMSAAGYGASRPLLPNYTSASRAKNRRVEILLLFGEKAS